MNWNNHRGKRTDHWFVFDKWTHFQIAVFNTQNLLATYKCWHTCVIVAFFIVFVVVQRLTGCDFKRHTNSPFHMSFWLAVDIVSFPPCLSLSFSISKTNSIYSDVSIQKLIFRTPFSWHHTTNDFDFELMYTVLSTYTFGLNPMFWLYHHKMWNWILK